MKLNTSALLTRFRQSGNKSVLLFYFYWSAYYFIAAVLLVSGFAKIIDPSGILNTLQSAFPFFNQDIIILTATLVPVIEIVLGMMLLLNIPARLNLFTFRSRETGGKKNIALISTSILFGCFFLFAVYGTISGLEEDCGCFGNLLKSDFGWEMIFRNFVFLLFSVFVLIQNKN